MAASVSPPQGQNTAEHPKKMCVLCGCWLQAAADNIKRCEDFQHAFFRAFFRRRGHVAFFRPFSAAFNTFTTAGTLEYVAFFRIQRGAAETARNTARGARLYSQIKAVAFFRVLGVRAVLGFALSLPRYMCAPLFARLSPISFLYRSEILSAALKAENAHIFRAPAVENALKTAEKRRKAAAPLWAEKPQKSRVESPRREIYYLFRLKARRKKAHIIFM